MVDPWDDGGEGPGPGAVLIGAVGACALAGGFLAVAARYVFTSLFG